MELIRRKLPDFDVSCVSKNDEVIVLTSAKIDQTLLIKASDSETRNSVLETKTCERLAFASFN